MQIILYVIVIGLYVSLLFARRSKLSISDSLIGKLRLVNIGLLFLFIILIILAVNNVYLRGYWTTKILIWLFLLSSMTLFAFVAGSLRIELKRYIMD